MWGGVRGGFREGWIVGACGAIQSSWPVAGGRQQSLRRFERSGVGGQWDAAERKRAKALREVAALLLDRTVSLVRGLRWRYESLSFK